MYIYIYPTGMVQQGQQRTEVPKSQRLEAMATSYPLTRQSGVLPSSNLFSSDIKWLRNTAMVWTVWDKCSITCIPATPDFENFFT